MDREGDAHDGMQTGVDDAGRLGFEDLKYRLFSGANLTIVPVKLFFSSLLFLILFIGYVVIGSWSEL